MTTITMNDRYQQDKVLSAVLAADSVLLFCHISPDGDALGSTLALKHRLERMGKTAQFMLDGIVPDNLAFLPGADTIITPDSPVAPYDLAFGVDLSSYERMGRCVPFWDKAAHNAQIDHHPTNPAFAQANMLDDAAPAAAQVVYRLLRMMDMPIDQEEAICLYTGLACDTGNFIYPATNAESFRIMGDLMDAGLPLGIYARLLFRQKEELFVRILGEALPSLRVFHGGAIAGLRLTHEQIARVGIHPSQIDGVVNYAIDLKGVKIAYFAYEPEPGFTRVSLRALEPYAVNGVAVQFGGGGHKLASGLGVAMPLDETIEAIEKALTEAYESVQ